MASKVYFADFRASGRKRNGLSKIGYLLEAVGLAQAIRPGDLTAIKVHFGERGNEAFISPVLARGVSDAVRAAGGKPFFADTNTLYSGGRSNAADHLETAALHGYVPAVCGAPVIIADGLRGTAWREVDVGLPRLGSVKIASAFLDADSMVVLTHFKGHEMAGFGGALKNLAMGCAPPIGKREQHAVKFFVKEDMCVSCGTCAENCPTGAASIAEGAKAFIDPATCIGCGECAMHCRARAIGLDWATEIVPFTERLVEYAYGAVKGMPGRVVYLTFVKDVVPDCDCAPWSDAPVVADQGILASLDPVAIDKAAYDLVKAAPVAPGSALEGKAAAGDDKFAFLHPETHPLVQIEHGERIGLGSSSYELVPV
jgi:uncharacterized Fe-S center protein